MRWLAHRGGALDFRDHALQSPGEPFPVAVALGADPATILGAVTPVPDTLSEYQFAGLLRGSRTEIVALPDATASTFRRSAEIVLEGFIRPDAADPTGYETAAEGPFGDHTGYYNDVERFPVFTIERITMRRDPIYHSTYTGKPPDEPAVLGVALNEVFVPLLQKQFPEIADFYLPPEGCSYRLAVVALKKQYPGHAKRVMFGVWSFLRQFMYTKFIIVTDDDVNVRDWKEVIWALTTRVDPARDTLIVEHTPIDYLDFASPVAGLGSKMGIDATNKWPGETTRAWGRPIAMDPAVKARVDALWGDLGLERSSAARCASRARGGSAISAERRVAQPARRADGRRRSAPAASTSVAASGRALCDAIGDGRRRDDRLDLVHRERDALAVELGARGEQRLPLGAGNRRRAHALTCAHSLSEPAREPRAVALELGERGRERRRMRLSCAPTSRHSASTPTSA